MDFYYMNEAELEIAKLKDINDIQLYDLVLSGNKESKPVVFGMMVFYGNNRCLNYCENDSLFEMFKQKVFNQYKIENQHREIRVDDVTKAFLCSDGLTNARADIESYLRCKPYQEPLINYGMEQFRRFESIFKYHLSALLMYFEKRYNIGQIKGYKKLLALDLGQKQIIIKVVNINNNSVQLELGGLLDNVNYLTVSINLWNDDINFFLVSDDESVAMNASYQLLRDGIYQEISISSKDKTMFYDKRLNDTKIKDEEMSYIKPLTNVEGLDSDVDVAYLLPWNAYFMKREKIRTINEQYSILDQMNAYIDKTETYINSMISNEISFTNANNNYKIRINGGIKYSDIYRINNSNKAVKQTYFEDLPYAHGLYKNLLSNKYFYSILEMDDFIKIGKIDVLPIDKESSIKLGYQLFEEKEIEKIKSRR